MIVKRQKCIAISVLSVLLLLTLGLALVFCNPFLKTSADEQTTPVLVSDFGMVGTGESTHLRVTFNLKTNPTYTLDTCWVNRSDWGDEIDVYKYIKYNGEDFQSSDTEFYKDIHQYMRGSDYVFYEFQTSFSPKEGDTLEFLKGLPFVLAENPDFLRPTKKTGDTLSETCKIRFDGQRWVDITDKEEGTVEFKAVDNGGDNACLRIDVKALSTLPYMANVSDTKVFINSFIELDGKPMLQYAAEKGTDIRINQAIENQYLYVWFYQAGTPNRWTIPVGTKITFRKGMGFVTQYGTPFGDTLKQDYEYRYYGNGQWGETGSADILELSDVTEKDGIYEFQITFSDYIVEQGQQLGADVLKYLSINDKALSEQNVFDGLTCNASENKLVISVKPNAVVPNAELHFKISGDTADGIQFPSGAVCSDTLDKWFINGDWAHNKVCDKIVPNDKILLIDNNSNNFKPARDKDHPEIVEFFIYFQDTIVSGDPILFYGSDTEWLYQNSAMAGGRTENSIDTAICDGTAQALRENFYLDDKPLSYYQSLDGVGLMIHYYTNFMVIYIDTNKTPDYFDMTKEHTVELKKDLFFPSGNRMNRDITFKYSPVLGGYSIIPITGMEINQTKQEISLFEEYRLQVNITPQDASVAKLKYESSNPKIIKVNKSGVVTGLQAGTATITVLTLDGSKLKKTIEITCKEVALKGMILNKSSGQYRIGSVLNVEVFYQPSDASWRDVRFSSSDPSVASVDENGIVKTLRVGTATITAESVKDPAITASFTVEVIRQTSALKIVPPTKTQYEVGEKLDTAGMEITVVYDDGTEEKISSAQAVISGFDNQVMGSQIVTVYYDYHYATFVVNVNAPSVNDSHSNVGWIVVFVLGAAVVGLGVTLAVFFKKRVK